MVSISVAVSVLFLGIPAIIFGILNIHGSAQQRVTARSAAIVTVIDRRLELEQPVTARLLEHYRFLSESEPLYLEYYAPGKGSFTVGEQPQNSDYAIRAVGQTQNGGRITVVMDSRPVGKKIAVFLLFAISLIIGAFTIGVLIALRQSRKISAPLIYLAASAEQLGAAQVRPQIHPSGIEEIDLVNQELERTADRVAGRIAAERQFAAAAAHQLRTPLTALSMRIEEIQYLTDDPKIISETDIALEQIERLGGVINELMASTKKAAHGNMEALSIDDIFHQQKDEWERIFEHAGRELKFAIETDAIVLATPGSLAQILATLIENSLKYGAGKTTVRALKSASMIVIKVKDQGGGISEELAPIIFMRGVSAGGSTGIGLAVAKELAENIGGRLELTSRESAEFTLTMRSMPASLDPSRLMPHGAVYTVGARRHRR
ncbi:ATP-binding protein [Arcanobacterium hippocoleae]